MALMLYEQKMKTWTIVMMMMMMMNE